MCFASVQNSLSGVLIVITSHQQRQLPEYALYNTYTTILYKKPIPGYLPFLSFSLPSPCVPGKGFTYVSQQGEGEWNMFER